MFYFNHAFKCIRLNIGGSLYLIQCKKINYDVIVVGGGHAGVEASAASARMGVSTLLITQKKSTIGSMACNPSFGGIGKGHLMKEVDALDGLCGRICDISGIHYKVLNKRKGPAVWGHRAQIDRSLYKKYLQDELFPTKHLGIIEASVDDIILRKNSDFNKGHATMDCMGVLLSSGQIINSSSVVIATGTFLRGVINIGLEQWPAGSMGNKSSISLAKNLEKLNFQFGRLRTGTPPRLEKSSIDFTLCQAHPPDNSPSPFSYMSKEVWIKPENQVNTYMTHTNYNVERIVMETLDFNRHVKEEVTGPRYCPSLESKVLRYPGRRHQIWLEPEGLDSPLIYPQGLSCTMPLEKQQELVSQIKGLEKANIIEPGYGVEYDYVNPKELTPHLETEKVNNLFFAGQINGTTGYEEAAAQGIVAGVNAAAKALGSQGLTVDRTEGYIGVLIDDLTTHGTSEPYRMFTSRSEFRMRLRPDNADSRLTKKGYDFGCVSKQRYEKWKYLSSRLNLWTEMMKQDLRLLKDWVNIIPNIVSSAAIVKKSAFDVIGQLDLDHTQFFSKQNLLYAPIRDDKELCFRLFVESHYSLAILREEEILNSVQMNQALAIPHSLNYFRKDLSLSNEFREKLSSVRPLTIAAASCIPGITPAAIASLMFCIRRIK